MATSQSPDVAHRVLASRLIKLRTQAGLTQTQAAKRLKCAQSRITHIESKRNPPRPEMLAAMLRVYDADDQLDELEGWRELVHRKEWWKSADLTSEPSGYDVYIGLFSGASAVRIFEMRMVHGMFQTEAYARAVMHGGQHVQIPNVDEKVAVRMRRKEMITREHHPVPVRIVMDEYALRRPVVSAEVMREQYEHLLDLAELPNVQLQVCPASVGHHPGLLGPFSVLHFPIEEDPGAVVIDTRVETVWFEATEHVQHYEDVLNQVSSLALGPAESAEWISKLRKEVK